VNFLNFKSCYYFDGTESKRGMFHWDSNIYPYFNSAITKGKWNLSDYKDDLLSVLEETGVDISRRGIV